MSEKEEKKEEDRVIDSGKTDYVRPIELKEGTKLSGTKTVAVDDRGDTFTTLLTRIEFDGSETGKAPKDAILSDLIVGVTLPATAEGFSARIEPPRIYVQVGILGEATIETLSKQSALVRRALAVAFQS